MIDPAPGSVFPDQSAQPTRDQAVELVAVINSFNRRELLQRAITSLAQALRQAPFASAIVVFEAGSHDGSKEFLETWGKENPGDSLVIVSPAGTRSSFSDGVNAGCAAALERYPNCQWLFLFETDNWLGGLRPLEQAVSLLRLQPRLAAAGFTVKRHDGAFCGYGMRFPGVLSLALGLNLSLRWNLDPPNESTWQTNDSVRWRTCDVVFTSPLLIRREAWEQTGGFDAEQFPFSDTDLDWAWRCAELGWKIAVIASEDVVHDNLEQASAWSANRVLEFHRSRVRLLKRHRGNRVSLIKPVLFLRHCAETILLACRSGSESSREAKLAKRRQMVRTVWRDYAP